MKITFTSNIPMTSKGRTYINGLEYDIDEAEAKRLAETFPTKFSIATKAKPAEKPVETPKSTKPKRSAKPSEDK